jgi:hypothetical protein
MIKLNIAESGVKHHKINKTQSSSKPQVSYKSREKTTTEIFIYNVSYRTEVYCTYIDSFDAL